ncbi:circularly permuted type 2 ATP-grasp protein [Jiella sp. KSK16Y-1]|uniref:Circularly permuted type 2 ATP-grasp protein n=2 Tax=Jiella mangrovi TaxID=2821407 RepID=A0ABS4BKC0_9HYPH|nr:circularly permuted type 2 ATP-grasp protein [Jiella mangrovi]
MIAPEGVLRPHYEPLMAKLSAMTEGELDRRFASSRQYLSEAGVFHQVYGEGAEQSHEWPLGHPALVIDRAEWQALSAGLVQRARFLEALLADIYGEGRMVAEGTLPGILIGRNPEFLRPLAGQANGSAPLLSFIAIDLGRGPDGRWWVLGDRTQAPSGAGFALENRVATSKAFPDITRALNVERLAGFFRRFREMLFALGGPERSRIGLLTPGPHNETYYEHAYLARYLGLLLLEGGDLVVHGDRAEVRTVDGFQPISVLWRRLDADFCDPLELFGGSRIGTPGLCRAVRSGALAVVNALGSGILETPALLAFQKPLAEALIGEELKLPTIATWWCGQEKIRRFVAENAARLQLGPAFPGAPPFPVMGETATRQGEASMAVPASTREGVTLVGQEIAALSTTPVFGKDGRLEPRPVTLRAFLMRDEEGWHVMPGGFARVADSRDARVISMQRGGGSIDVWIPSPAPAAKPVTLLGAKGDRFSRRLPGALPARAADNLFWLGRYAERCETAARLLRLHAARAGEGWSEGELEARVALILSDCGVETEGGKPQRGLLALARQAAGTASRIRERFSPDAWRTLNDVVALILDALAEEDEDVVALTSAVLTHMSGFAGLAHENMYQFTGWRFMQCGRALERGQATAMVVSSLLADEPPAGALEALLAFTDSSVTYRRRYSVDLSEETVVDLAVLDPLNPRSLAFQVNLLADVISSLPGVHLGQSPDLLQRRLARLKVRLQTADGTEVDTAFLDRVVDDLALISDLITQRYLLSSPRAAAEWSGGPE